MELQKLGFGGKFIKFVHNFLENRSSKVKINGYLSGEYKITNGVPQGSCLPPLLFLVLINSLPNKIIYSNPLLYADDFVLLIIGKCLKILQKKLQTDLNSLENWSENNGLSASEEKTTATVFTHRRNYANIDLYIKGKKIKTENSVRYLGIIFDKNLSFNKHIESIENSCNKNIGLFKRLSGTSWGMGKSELTILYKSLVLSRILYASTVLSGISKTNLTKLKQIQYSFLKIITGAVDKTKTEYLEVDTGVFPVDLAIKKHTFSFISRSLAFPNPITQNILEKTWHSEYSKTKDSSLLIIADSFLRVAVPMSVPYEVSQNNSNVCVSQLYLFPDITGEIKKNAFINIVIKLITEECQLRWDNLKSSVYKTIYPYVQNNARPPFYNSRKINRLRYGKTTLTKYYKIVGIGQDCPLCGMLLNTAHLLLTCTYLPLVNEIKQYCNSHEINHNLTEILTDKGCIRIILAANY